MNYGRLGLLISVLLLPVFVGAGCADEPTVDSEPADLEDRVADVGLAGCAKTSTVVVYTQGGWGELLDAMQSNDAPCVNVFISTPATEDASTPGEKTTPRGDGVAASIRARGARFHALAEFHWGSWQKWVSAHPREGWVGAGHEFRRRMVANGYDVGAGDTWAINEAPSTLRTSAKTRVALRSAVLGLDEGAAGMPNRAGAVFAEGMGSLLGSFGTYRSHMHDLFADARFWEQMNRHVTWWAQEVYASPDQMCVSGASLQNETTHLESYLMHEPIFAGAGPGETHLAYSYLKNHFVPMLNGVFRATAYSTDSVDATQMMRFISTQVYAARTWSSNHPYPGRRVGLAWDYDHDVVSADEATEIAARAAGALRGAYEGNGTAASACEGPEGKSWCGCEVAGASFNDGWAGLATKW